MDATPETREGRRHSNVPFLDRQASATLLLLTVSFSRRVRSGAGQIGIVLPSSSAWACLVQAYPDNLGLLDGSRVRVWLTPQSKIVPSPHAKGSETERVRWRMEISGEGKEERIGMECHLVSVLASTFQSRKF